MGEEVAVSGFGYGNSAPEQAPLRCPNLLKRLPPPQHLHLRLMTMMSSTHLMMTMPRKSTCTHRHLHRLCMTTMSSALLISRPPAPAAAPCGDGCQANIGRRRKRRQSCGKASLAAASYGWQHQRCFRESADGKRWRPPTAQKLEQEAEEARRKVEEERKERKPSRHRRGAATERS